MLRLLYIAVGGPSLCFSTRATPRCTATSTMVLALSIHLSF